MKKILLLSVFCMGGFLAKPSTPPVDPPKYSIIATSCGTRHNVSADLSKDQLAKLLAHYEEVDCGN